MKCPICKKEVEDKKYRPFCSKRCADIDLGRWFDGTYRFAAERMDEKDVEELEKALTQAADEEEPQD